MLGIALLTNWQHFRKSPTEMWRVYLAHPHVYAGIELWECSRKECVFSLNVEEQKQQYTLKLE